MTSKNSKKKSVASVGYRATICGVWTRSDKKMVIWDTLICLFRNSTQNSLLSPLYIFQLHLYGGLVVFCGFILYDTQLIIEKKRNGDNDFIWHSVDLFLDFVNIFRRILIILSNKEEKKRKNNKD